MNRVNVNDFPLAGRLGVNHPEPVPFLESEEIHRPGVNVLKVDKQHRGCAGSRHVIPERRRDRHVRELPGMFNRLGHPPCPVGLCALEYCKIDPVPVVHEIFQHLCIEAVHAVISLPGISGPHFPRFEHGVGHRHQLHGIGLSHAQPGHQPGKDLASGDFALRKVE